MCLSTQTVIRHIFQPWLGHIMNPGPETLFYQGITRSVWPPVGVLLAVSGSVCAAFTCLSMCISDLGHAPSFSISDSTKEMLGSFCYDTRGEPES